MGILMGCGICCMCLSVWAIIQLCLMGFFYHIETPILIEDVHAHKEDYNSYDEYIKVTRDNYAAAALNCWITAAAYGVTLLLSCMCIASAKKSAAREAKMEEDDEFVCMHKPTTFEKLEGTQKGKKLGKKVSKH